MLLIVAGFCVMLIAIAVTIDVGTHIAVGITVHVVASYGGLAPRYSDPRVT